VAPIEITTELMFNQPPTSGRFLIPDSRQAACSQLTNSVSYNGQTGNHTYFSRRNIEFNIGRVRTSLLQWIREKLWYVISAHAGFLHLELRVEWKRAQDLIDDTW